jgi:hypothetical protein
MHTFHQFFCIVEQGIIPHKKSLRFSFLVHLEVLLESIKSHGAFGKQNSHSCRHFVFGNALHHSSCDTWQVPLGCPHHKQAVFLWSITPSEWGSSGINPQLHLSQVLPSRTPQSEGITLHMKHMLHSYSRICRRTGSPLW